MARFMSPSILITGATGTIGSELAKQLSEKGIPFRAMIRSAARAESLASLKGAELITGDFNDPVSIRKALEGIDRVFLLTNSTPQAEAQQMLFAELVKESGVGHIVKLSQLAAELNSPVRFLRYHAAVEQKIRSLGMDFTFLRPNLFMQGLLAFRDPIIHQGKFFAAIGDAAISLVDIRDIASVAASALTESGHAGKTYDITGPETLTHDQIAQVFSEVLGRQIRFIEVSPDDMRQAILGAGFPEWQADGLIEDYAHYARGEAAAVSTVVKDITGKQARDLKNFIRDHIELFR